MTLIFMCLRTSCPIEAEILGKALPNILGQFFPAMSIINRIINNMICPGHQHLVRIIRIIEQNCKATVCFCSGRDYIGFSLILLALALSGQVVRHPCRHIDCH